MILNRNFVLRDIFSTYILFPIKHNNTSNHPIYINDVVFRIITEARYANNKTELFNRISEIYKLSKEEDLRSLRSSINQLVSMEILQEGEKDDSK